MKFLQKEKLKEDLTEISQENRKKHIEIFNACKQALEALDSTEKNEDILTNEKIIQPFLISLQTKNKICILTISNLYYFLINNVLKEEDIEIMIRCFSKTVSNEEVSIKILQSAPYLMRYENKVVGDLLFALFYIILQMSENHESQVKSTAKIISKQIVNLVFDRVNKNEENQKDALRMFNLFIQILNKTLPSGTHLKVSNLTILDILEISLNSNIYEIEEFNSPIKNSFKSIATFLKDGSISEQNRALKCLLKLMDNKKDKFEEEIKEIFNLIEKVYKNKKEIEQNAIIEFLNAVDDSYFLFLEANFHFFFSEILYSIKEDGQRMHFFVKIRNFTFQQAEPESSKRKENAFFQFFYDTFYDFLSKKEKIENFFVEEIGKTAKEILFYLGDKKDENAVKNFIILILKKKNHELTKCCVEGCVGIRGYMQDAWGSVFENLEGDSLDLLIESSSLFNSEELYFLIKGTSHNEKDLETIKKLFLRNIKIIVEPENIRIFRIILENCTESENFQFMTTLILEYYKNVDISTFTRDMEEVPFTFLLTVIQKNVEENGSNVLTTLKHILRIISDTLSSSWLLVFEILNATVDSKALANDNFSVLQIIVEDNLNYLTQESIEKIILCLYKTCTIGEDMNTSLNSISSLQDTGSFLARKRMERKKEYNELWKFFIETAAQLLKDERTEILSTSIKLVFNFLITEKRMLSSSELKFTESQILVPCLLRMEQLVGENEKKFICLKFLDEICRFLEGANVCGFSDFIFHFFDFSEKILFGDRQSEILKDELFLGVISVFRIIGENLTKGAQNLAGEDAKTGYEDIKTHILQSYINICNDVPLPDFYRESTYVALLNLYRSLPIDKESTALLFPGLTRLVQSKNTADCKNISPIQKAIFEIFNSKDTLLLLCEWLFLEDDVLTFYILEETGRIMDQKIPEDTFRKVMKTLAQFSVSKDKFWEKGVAAIKAACKNIQTHNEFSTFIECSSMLFGNPKTESINFYEQPSHIATFYDTIVDYEINSINSQDSIKLRRREKILLDFLEFYEKIVVQMEENGAEMRDAYFLLFCMSAVEEGRCKEKISFRCYEIMFDKIKDLKENEESSRSCNTKEEDRESVMSVPEKTDPGYHKNHKEIYDLLKRRIQLTLIEFLRDVKIFDKEYPKIKREEIYLIFKKLDECRSRRLVYDLRESLIDSLGCRDFYVIDNVKNCLKMLFDGQ